jgi:cbb3-type cytochrome oxidase subunit 3
MMTNPHGSLPDLSIVICFISFGIVAHFLSNGKRKNNDFRNRPPFELPPQHKIQGLNSIAAFAKMSREG